MIGGAFYGLFLLLFSLQLRLLGVLARSSDSDFKIICYEHYSYFDDILPNTVLDHCTHVVYYQLHLHDTNLTVVSVGQLTLAKQQIAACKNANIKVGAILGGWTDSSGTDKYSRLVRNAKARARFVKHTIEFLQMYEIGGLEIAWMHPGNYQDRIGYGKLMKELYAAFKRQDMFLSAHIPHDQKILANGYGVGTLAKWTDWLTLNVPSVEYFDNREHTTSNEMR